MPPVARERAGSTPVEALEDAGQVGLGDADALVADRDLDARTALFGILGGARADGDAGAARAVGDRVVDQVGDRHGQLALVAADDEAGGSTRVTTLIAGLARRRAGCGPAPRRAMRPPTTSSRRAAARRPAAATARSARAPAGPAATLSCWIRPAKRCTASGSSAASCTASASRVSAPDRRLELVRHVGDEVAPHGLEAARLGHVVEHQRHRADPAARRSRPATGRR